jgi:RNA polymerase sigma-70 factor (ECF subfamily)
MGTVKDIEHSFRLYYRQLCLYGLHFTDNLEAVEDIVQEAFVGLWQRKDEVRDVKPYLYASVRNKCISYLKKQHGGTEAVPEDIPSEELEDRSEVEARLWSAIDSLPDRRRQVLLMSKRDGMKYEDIAYMLGISVHTVRNHISKALEALRNLPYKIYSLFFCAG